MRKLIGVTLLLSIFALSSFVLAQKPQQLAESALARLDRDLQFAQSLIQTFPNPRAERLLKKAYEERNRARMALRQRRFSVVKMHVEQAQIFIDLALKQILEGPVARQRERLRELIRRADNVVVGSGNVEAEQLLRKAKRNQNLALRAFQEKRFRQAVEFYRTAIFLAERSIALVTKRFKNIEDKYTEEKERFEHLLERAKAKVKESGKEQARQLLLQAMHQAQKAQDAVHKGNYLLAIDTYYQATRLLIRAIDLAEKQPAGIKRKVEQELVRLQDLIYSTRDQIERGHNPRARFLFQKALNFNNEARRAFQNGNLRKAMSKINVAKHFLRQAVRLQEGVHFQPKKEIGDELAALEEKLRSLSAQAKEKPERMAPFVREAWSHYEKARQALDAGKFGLALERIWISSHFASKAQELLKKSERRSLSVNAVKKELERLEITIREIGPVVESSKIMSAKMLFAQVHDIEADAQAALAKGHLQLAAAYIDIAKELLVKIARLVNVLKGGDAKLKEGDV